MEGIWAGLRLRGAGSIHPSETGIWNRNRRLCRLPQRSLKIFSPIHTIPLQQPCLYLIDVGHEGAFGDHDDPLAVLILDEAADALNTTYNTTRRRWEASRLWLQDHLEQAA
ncbi:MAG: hypothetical protein SH809_20145 [Rhodothermales bacterium]|nr:hypothetical protein [Rhodothermales bacterium]